MFKNIWTLQRGLFTFVFNITVDWEYNKEQGDCLICTVAELPEVRIVYYDNQDKWHDAFLHTTHYIRHITNLRQQYK